MRGAIFEVAALKGLGSLEKNQLSAILDKESRRQRIVTHGVLIEAPGLDIDVNLGTGHPQNFRIKLLRTVEIVDRQAQVMNSFNFKHFPLLFFILAILLVTRKSPYENNSALR